MAKLTEGPGIAADYLTERWRRFVTWAEYKYRWSLLQSFVEGIGPFLLGVLALAWSIIAIPLGLFLGYLVWCVIAILPWLGFRFIGIDLPFFGFAFLLFVLVRGWQLLSGRG